MKLIVNPHKVEIDKEEAINEKEINISICKFEFADEITDDYVKEAYFTYNGKSYKQIIVNNMCTFPQEVLVKEGTVELGVVATYTDLISGDITRYNPSPVYFKTDLGSLREAQNSQPITPSEMEQYEQALNDGLESLDNALDDLQEKVDSGYFDGQDGVDGITPTIGDNGNWYLDDEDTGKPSRGEQGIPGETGATGSPGIDGYSPIANVSKNGSTATITITDKNGTTTTTISDGTNGTNGRDGYIQYTAGDNITIDENNVISAEGGDLSNYYTKAEIDAKIIYHGRSSNYSTSEGALDLGELPIGLSAFYIDKENAYQTSFYVKARLNGTYYYNEIEIPIKSNSRKVLDDILYIYKRIEVPETQSEALYFGKWFYSYVDFDSCIIAKTSKDITISTNNILFSTDTSQNNSTSFLNTSIQQTINAKKTFSVLPESSVAPSTNNQFTNKKYVDDSIASAITDALGGNY